MRERLEKYSSDEQSSNRTYSDESSDPDSLSESSAPSEYARLLRELLITHTSLEQFCMCFFLLILQARQRDEALFG
jgi:hypothetical protein